MGRRRSQAAVADTATVYSEAQKLGNGVAQVYAELTPQARRG